MKFGTTASQSGALYVYSTCTEMAHHRNHQTQSLGDQSMVTIELPGRGGVRSPFPLRGGKTSKYFSAIMKTDVPRAVG